MAQCVDQSFKHLTLKCNADKFVTKQKGLNPIGLDLLTLAAIPPTNIVLGMTISYLGVWSPDKGVELGEQVVPGEPSAEDWREE